MEFYIDINQPHEVICSVAGGEGDKKLFLGRVGTCRFCDNDTPTFRQKAHTFPESLGNKSVFSHDECDACNALFSKYETALTDCLRPLLTLGGVKGKRKVPQSGRTSGDTHIKHNLKDGKRHISWNAKIQDFENIISVNRKTRVLKALLPIPGIPFVPRYAYKALAKMAFALLPESEIARYSNLRRWLHNMDGDEELSTLDVLISFTSIGNAPPVIAGVLLRRVEQTDKASQIIFLFMAGSICLQITLVPDSMEEHILPVATNIIKMRWKTILLGESTDKPIELSYSEPFHLNWANRCVIPQPLEGIELEYNHITCRGTLKPIFRIVERRCCNHVG